MLIGESFYFDFNLETTRSLFGRSDASMVFVNATMMDAEIMQVCFNCFICVYISIAIFKIMPFYAGIGVESNRTKGPHKIYLHFVARNLFPQAGTIFVTTTKPLPSNEWEVHICYDVS